MLVRHGSLTANTVTTVTLTRTSPGDSLHYVNDSFKMVEVVNRGTSAIFFNFVEFNNNVAQGSPGAPTVSGDNTWVVPAGGALTVPVPSQSITTTDGVRTYEARVRLVAAATTTYSVTAP